jgi:predicted dehydrogenase
MNNNPTASSRRAFFGAASAGLLASSATELHSVFGGESDDDAGKEPVRVVVIGTGARGADLIRSLTTIEGVAVVGVCDDYEPHLAQGAKYAGPQAETFADYRQALDRLKPRAVVIAVPLNLHFPVARDALDAGCDVFCEKTMCYRIDEARRLAQHVAKTGHVFQVGLQRRANPIYQQAAAMVRSGVLGAITAIKAQWHRNNNWRRPVPVPRTDARYAALERRLNWRLYRESSDGLMSELGSHQLDVANWFLGTTPRRVFASGGTDYWRDGREVYDNIFCIYDYEPPAPAGPRGGPGGAPYTVRVTYSSLCNNAYEGASELIMGTRGSLYLTTEKGLLFREMQGDEIEWATSGRGGDSTREKAERDAAIIAAGKTLKLSDSPWARRGEPLEIDNLGGDDTRDELVSFIAHVRRRDPKTLVDARTGLLNTATVLIANEAAERGQAIPFPADLGSAATKATLDGLG